MKKAISIRICIVMAVSMTIVILLNFYLQIKSAKEAMYANSMIYIEQITQILDQNDADIELLKENLREDYIIRAKAAAYIIQQRPEVIGDLEEIRKIAALLQIDELHLFNPEGTLYFGTQPQYYDFTFNSGEQMQFFLPLLDDYSLELCQEVTPNTAEAKLMQYLGVWQEDRLGIVQIGMEPVRLLEAMKQNELPHLFTLLTTANGISAFAANSQTGEILGATNAQLTGQNMSTMGIYLSDGELSQSQYVTTILGEKNFVVVQKVRDVLVGISCTYDTLYQTVPANMLLISLSLLVLSGIIILLILKMLDHFIINGIKKMMIALRQIGAGDLDASVDVTNSKEFIELSASINSMVKSLLQMTGKLSLVFENVNIPIAVYEYSLDMSRVLVTSKFVDILQLEDEAMHSMVASREVFCEKIQEITANSYNKEKDIYQICAEPERYVRIKSYKSEHQTLGIIVDITDEVVENKKIKFERDIDLLTGLYSRRAFSDEMQRLFSTPEVLKTAMFLMVDLDNLKSTNDTWGHDSGDRLLQAAADVLKACDAPHKMVTRLSGDEFVLMIYAANSQQEILNYLDNLTQKLAYATITMPNGAPLKISLSGGYVFFPEVNAPVNELLHLADKTMYQVKKSGKGRFERYVQNP